MVRNRALPARRTLDSDRIPCHMPVIMNLPLRDIEPGAVRSPLAAEVERRRTFAIISHPDAGKTTLTEKLLLFGGAIHLAGQVKAKRDRRNTRSDWMEIERERGISVVTSVMTFEYDGLRLQPARHAGPRGLFRGHLPHADRGRLRGDGDRRRQGHRGAHAQAVRGLPAARHPDHHLHQQDGPREPRSVRAARRDRKDAGARHHADDLAGRPRPRLRSAPTTSPPAACGCSKATAARPARLQQIDIADARRAAIPISTPPRSRKNSSWCKEACRPFDLEAFREGHLTPVYFGSALKNFGVGDLLEALGALRAAAARAGRATCARSRRRSRA